MENVFSSKNMDRFLRIFTRNKQIWQGTFFCIWSFHLSLIIFPRVEGKEIDSTCPLEKEFNVYNICFLNLSFSLLFDHSLFQYNYRQTLVGNLRLFPPLRCRLQIHTWDSLQKMLQCSPSLVTNKGTKGLTKLVFMTWWLDFHNVY